MKIGLVGSEGGVHAVSLFLKTDNMFNEIIGYPCAVEHVAGLLDSIQSELDGILFAGNDHISYAYQKCTPKIPWVYAKLSTSSTLRALLQATTCFLDISRITFDLKETSIEQMAYLLATEGGLDANGVYVYRFAGVDKISVTAAGYINDATAFHLDNLKSGRANVCLSGIRGVVDNIKSKGFPAFWVTPSEESVYTALNELSLKHQLYIHQSNSEQGQIAVIAISVELTEPFVQNHKHLVSCHQIDNYIFEFAQRMGAAVEKSENTQYLIYTTTVEASVMTNGFSQLPLLQKLQDIPNVKYASAGIGLAVSHGAARSNALNGHHAASKQKYGCYYIMDGTSTMAGPFKAVANSFEKPYEEIRTEKISDETGVGIIILNALTRAQIQYGFDTVTSGELAKMCGMTVSNMNRIITKLEEKGYAKITGVRPNNGAGRPSRLIRLKLENM